MHQLPAVLVGGDQLVHSDPPRGIAGLPRELGQVANLLGDVLELLEAHSGQHSAAPAQDALDPLAVLALSRPLHDTLSVLDDQLRLRALGSHRTQLGYDQSDRADNVQIPGPTHWECTRGCQRIFGTQNFTNLVDFKQSSGALEVPCYMTDRGARPSLWRRPGLALRTTGDVTPATIYNSSAAALARSNPVRLLGRGRCPAVLRTEFRREFLGAAEAAALHDSQSLPRTCVAAQQLSARIDKTCVRLSTLLLLPAEVG